MTGHTTYYLDLGLGGHRLSYLKAVVGQWKRGGVGELVVLLPRDVLENPPGDFQGWRESLGSGIRFQSLPCGYGRNNFLDTVATYLNGKQGEVFIPNAEPFFPLLQKTQLGFSGLRFLLLCFKPLLHYPFLGFERFGIKAGLRPGTYVYAFSSYMGLNRSGNRLRILLLDPYAKLFYTLIFRNLTFEYVPDILEPPANPVEPEEAKVKAHKVIPTFLIPGSLDHRKTIIPFLESLSVLVSTGSGMECRVILAGVEHPDITRDLDRFGTRPRMEVLRINRFLSNEEMEWAYGMADVVVALYSGFIGMSGILVNAVARNKILLATRHGLVGRFAKPYVYCARANERNPVSILRAIRKCLRFVEMEERPDRPPSWFRHENHEFETSVVHQLGLLRGECTS